MSDFETVHEEEKAFVKRFIAANRQDRYLLFLSQEKMRGKFLSELYHRLAFRDSLATRVLPRDQTVVEQRLLALGSRAEVYVLSPAHRLDQQWHSLTDVLDDILSTSTEAIVCCLRGELAFYKSENGAYILHYHPNKPTV